MTIVKKCVTTSAVLAGMSVLCQTVSFIIPGWFITETKKFSLNMALWYVVLCERNITTNSEACGTVSYKHLFSEQNEDILTALGEYILTKSVTYKHITF